MGAIGIVGVVCIIVGVFVTIYLAFLGMVQGVVLEILPGIGTVISGIIIGALFVTFGIFLIKVN